METFVKKNIFFRIYFLESVEFKSYNKLFHLRSNYMKYKYN